MTLLFILLASFVIMLASLSGKLATVRLLGPVIERNLSFLVSFAAGVLLVVVYGILQEVVEHAGTLKAAIPWVVAGALCILVVFRYVPNFHHHHDEREGGHVHDVIDANRVLTSDAIHNTTDGILLAAAFSTSPLLGLMTTMSVFLHELVQEVSEYFVLRQAGLSATRALLFNFAASSTILVGALGGYFLIEQFEALKLPMLGIAAGSYLIVVFHDLIPHSLRHSQREVQYLSHGAWFMGGILLMSLVAFVVGH